MPHKLWKISARSSKRRGVQLRKIHGGVASTPPPLTGRGLREKSQYARPDPTQPDPTRPDPTRPHDAFEKLIPLDRVDRFTSGLLCSMSPITIQYISYLTDTDTRQWMPRHMARAEWEGVGDTLPSITPWRLARLRSNLVCLFRDQLAINFTQVRCWVGTSAFCTCAREHLVSLSRKRLDELR